MKAGFLLSILFLGLCAGAVWGNGDAVTMKKFSFQGFLTDANGNPVPDAARMILLRVYPEAAGGDPLWEEGQMVETRAGYYSTVLGDSIPVNLPFDQQYWLGVRIDGEEEMSPRIPFTSVPYAARAMIADSLAGGGGEVGGTGNANNIAKFTGPSTIGNSVVYENNGQVGISVVNTTAKLHICQTGSSVGLDVDNDEPSAASTQTWHADAGDNGNCAQLLACPQDHPSYPGRVLFGGTSPTKVLQFLTGWGGTDGKFYFQGGEVGIGVETPVDKLEVAGTAKVTGFKLTTDPGPGKVLTSDASGTGTWQTANGGIGGGGTASYLPLFTGPAAIGNSIAYQNGDNIGIGTTSPGAKLNIVTGPNSVGLRVESPNSGYVGQTWAAGPAGEGTQAKIVTFSHDDPANPGEIWIGGESVRTNRVEFVGGADTKYSFPIATSKVGIGTEDPMHMLELWGGTLAVRRTDGSQWLELRDDDAAGARVFSHSREDNKKPLLLGALHDGSGAPVGETRIEFEVGAETSPTTAMYISEAGNVGIGTTSPGSRLAVEGSPSAGASVLQSRHMGTATGVIAVVGESAPNGVYSGVGGRFVGGSTGCEASATRTGDSNPYGSAMGVHAQADGGTAGTNTAVYAYAATDLASSATCFAGDFKSEGKGVNYGMRAGSTGGTMNYGVYASAPGGGNDWAGWFSGRVYVGGYLYKNGGGFRIDHPLDPAGKYLYHSFVESPDMMNLYNGNVILDGTGEGWVEMPRWFEALNQEFRYQLTCVGGFAPVYVADEIAGNRFRIAGGRPGLKVSWQVTGIRHDPYAESNRIPVEENKTGAEAGKYLQPGVYGMPQSMGIDPEAGLERPGGRVQD